MTMGFFARVDSPFRLARGLARRGLHRLGLRPDARVWHRGLPPGLDPELYASIASGIVGGSVKNPSYVHLSPFKAIGGAYRIRARTEAGTTWSACFKDCRYDVDAAPGLKNLPARPGPPEYAVYARSTGRLRHVLPRVFHAEEVVSGLHYRYLLEDVSPRYSKPLTDTDIVRATRALHTLHAAASEWAHGSNDDALIRYDRQFMQQLAAYANNALEAYAGSATDRTAISSSTLLAEMLEVLADPQYPGIAEPVAIHGDFNRASLLVDSSSPDGFRVIDWEWAGIGPAHFDLARLLEKSDDGVADQALRHFAELEPSLSPEQHTRLYHWARIATSIMSAALLAVDIAESRRTPRVDRAAYLETCFRNATVSLTRI